MLIICIIFFIIVVITGSAIYNVVTIAMVRNVLEMCTGVRNGIVYVEKRERERENLST